MTIGITGATGHLGRLVVEKLRHRVRQEDIVALARSPDKGRDLGVEVRRADYEVPDTLASALPGVDTLLLISSSELGRRAAHHRNVVDAAKAAGVKRLVYTSLLHADTSTLDLAEEHLASEAAVRESGIAFTFLRNGWYTENHTASLGGYLAGGAVIGSADSGRFSSAPRDDFAEAAVEVLTGSDHAGRVYELAGDESYSLAELAAELSAQTGRKLPYRDLPVEDYAAALVGFGLPEPIAKRIAGWDVAASQGALFDDEGQLSKLIGRPTTPMSESVATALAGLDAGGGA